MSTRSRPKKPVSRPAPRPSHLRQHDKRVPRARDVFAWAPGELLIGEPRADRKAPEPGNA